MQICTLRNILMFLVQFAIATMAFAESSLDKFSVETLGDNTLIKMPDQTNHLEVVLSTYRNLPPLGVRNKTHLTIIGTLSKNTLTWILGQPDKGDKATCQLNLSKQQKKEFLEEDMALVKMPESAIEVVETLAGKLCRMGISNLLLHSPGGEVISGKILAMAVKLAGITTEVPNGALCASACVEVLVKGKEVKIDDSAIIMVHRPSNDGKGIPYVTYSRNFLPPNLKLRVKEGENFFLTGKVAKELGILTQSGEKLKMPVKAIQGVAGNGVLVQ